MCGKWWVLFSLLAEKAPDSEASAESIGAPSTRKRKPTTAFGLVKLLCTLSSSPLFSALLTARSSTSPNVC